MALSRRALLVALGATGAAGLSACTGRSSNKRAGEKESPEADSPTEPDAELVVGVLSGSYGRAGRWQRQISSAISEARLDINAAFGGVFGRPLRLLPAHVVKAPGEDLSGVISGFADQGATAVITNLDEESLLAAMPHLVAAKMAVIDVATTSSALRAPGVESAGLHIRLLPTDRILAAQWAEASRNAAGGDKAGDKSVAAFVGENTVQGKNLAQDLAAAMRDVSLGRLAVSHLYTPGSFTDQAAVVKKIVAARPSLLVIDGGPQDVGPFLTALHAATHDAQGRATLEITLRLSQSATVDYAEQKLPPKALARAQGMQAGGALTTEHVNMMLNVDRSLLTAGFAGSQQAYDALILLALAAYDALSVSGTDLAESVKRLLTGAQACPDTAQCRTAMADARREGKRADLRYQGRSGDLQLGPRDDPATGGLRTYGWTENGALAAPSDTTFKAPEK